MYQRQTLIHRTIQSERNARRCRRVLAWHPVPRSNHTSKVMKVLNLAAVAAIFAAIFCALMLCGAALTATLNKAIAAAPLSVVLS
jgi:hypothetical protein